MPIDETAQRPAPPDAPGEDPHPSSAEAAATHPGKRLGVLLLAVAIAAAAVGAWVFVVNRSHHPEHAAFVALANRICRSEAAELARTAPTLSPTVAADLRAGRLTADARTYLVAFAQAFIVAGEHATATLNAATLPVGDRAIANEYEAAAQRALPALTALKAAASDGDLAAVQKALQELSVASQRNSDLNERLGLRSCGTLGQPASTSS